MNNAKTSNRDLSALYPDLKVRYLKLKADMKDHFKDIFLTDGFRSFERQNHLYALGRTIDDTKRVTDAKAGESFHNYGLAFDVAFIGPEMYSENNPWNDLGRIGKAHGLEWGGDFSESKRDRPHFQLRYGMQLNEIQYLYKQGGLEKLWSRIDYIRGVPIGEKWYGPQRNI